MKKEPLVFKTYETYEKEWAKVDSFEQKGLPKSALEIVEKIYNDSRKTKNHNQFIKALLHRLKYKNSNEEDAFENLIYEINDEIKLASFPMNSIMHSILAEMYWMYYQNNRWRFYNRSTTVNFEMNDMKTWDLNTLSDNIIKEFLLSIDNVDSLQRAQIQDFNDILNKGTYPENIRPTLFDFLANRAITVLSNQELSVSKPADYFEIKEDFYFAENQDFINSQIKTKDSSSTKFHVITLFQRLLKFHFEEKNNEALIDADLCRLNFVHKNSVHDLNDSLYLSALLKLENEFANNKYIDEVSHAIAQFYNEKSTAYNGLQKETEKYKWYKQKAFKICNSIIEKDSNSVVAQKSKYLLNNITDKTISFETEHYIIPDENFAVKISYKNTPKAYVRIAKLDYEKVKKIKENDYSYELYDKIYKSAELLSTKEIALPNDNDFNPHSTEIVFDKLPQGLYLIVVSDNKEFSYNAKTVSYQIVSSTNLSYFYKNNNSQEYDYYLVNRKSGTPLQNVKVNLFYREYNYTTRRYQLSKGNSFVSNEQGYVKITSTEIKNENNFYVEIVSGNDVLFSDYSYYLYSDNYSDDTRYSTHIFTDRAIYRPGQTIYFKGILIHEVGDKREIVPNFKQTVTLYDVNYQKISDIELTTNEFGTFNGTFEIPTGLLNGEIQINTSYGSKFVSVEEYKRPKFEVVVNPLKGNYLLNETIEIIGKAKAYSGAALTDAKVAYRIVREPVWRSWWYFNYGSTTTEILSGECKTDDAGEYKISFNAIPDLRYPKKQDVSFNYSAYIDVTDINGETQSTQKNIRVGYVALDVSTNILDLINKDKTLEYYVISQNLNYEDIKSEGSIKIFALKDVAEPLRNRLWSQPDQAYYSKADWQKLYAGNVFEDENKLENFEKGSLVYEQQYKTSLTKEFKVEAIKNWKEGAYIVQIQSKDSFGNAINYEKRFKIYSEKSIQMPLNTTAWHATNYKSFEPGENAEIFIGSSKENVKVLYEIEHKEKIIKTEWLTLNKEQKKIILPIIEDYRGNVSAHFTFIIDNRFYNYDDVIYVPFTNKQLDIKFETFRNKLYPGEKEEWKLVLKGKKGEKVAAEMLATLYDASLDNFRQNYWSFNIFRSYYSSLSSRSDVFNSIASTNLKQNGSYFYYPSQYYDYLNWYGFSYYSYGYYRNGHSNSGGKTAAKYKDSTMSREEYAEMDGVTAKGESMPAPASAQAVTGTLEDVVDKRDAEGEQVVDRTEANQQGLLAEGRAGNSSGEVKVRTNFNETAFFYPNLQTNENGEVVIKFTIPESLTKWKMMGLAHTKDLMSGYIENELVTQKELMVMPNAPRFFRENDKIVFPAKISNVADKTQVCDVSVSFYDAITMKDITPIVTKSQITQKVTVEAGKNAVIKWTLNIPEGVFAIGYKVIAKSNIFSDGEENVIPVMTNRMLVTESLPLPVRRKGTQNFEFTKLLNSKNSTTIRNHNFTLEFTSNPAWYAVQALPYLIEYPYECAEQTFSRYYANSIASYIANSNPKIKSVFDSWKNQPDSKALLSNLEKNQELKSVMLEETPWVIDAQDETERKKRIGLLFDLNKMSNELRSAITKLKKLQVSNGGWPWFEGMPDSRYITQHIVCGFGHLDKLNVVKSRENNDVWSMVSNAIPYLDKRILEDYQYLKKYYTSEEMKLDHIGQIQIQYLYTRSFFQDIKLNGKEQEAYDYYFAQAQKYWLNKDKYSQALIGLALFRKSDLKTPADITKSLKEHSLTSEEMGMYWKDNVSGYYWYQAPIETQAIMIELFNETTNEQNTVEDLKVWLLKQKQTQDWKTTKATVEAVYALLVTGKDWLNNTELVKVTLGSIVVDPTNDKNIKTEAGTGYFKKSWTANEIQAEMGNISVTKANDGVAWGAVYWQYFEQLDKITPHETPLKLNKKLFIEKNSDKGKVIEPISSSTKLKLGDKIIVRIELRVDRDMDYVHMKDMRASGFEPLNVFSGYRWQDGLGYYQTTKDGSTNFFFDRLNKGTYVFEYPLRINHEGNFSNGITTIQCMYAPEFTSHSEGVRVVVE
ncbi:MAG: hypothetical protein A2W98_02310 [Bacteroidetes bacterium GWF2_33_38]|nr:MAG: hypothetical protein A2W98_02310 [Bacteroidetes bacterium GWF2_33_38]